MKAVKASLFVVLVLFATIGLLFVAFSVAYWTGMTGNLDIAGRQFKVLPLHTNDMSGVGIVDAKTGEPLWVNWTFGDGSHQICYYFNGTNILNLHLWKGRPPGYDVGFSGPGKSSVWWWDLGRGTFIERNFFDTNGDFSKLEVWYNDAWHTGVKQNGKMGIVISGRWYQLSLPTNAMWTIEAATNAP